MARQVARLRPRRGVRREDGRPRRLLFSSVNSFIPLQRDVHKGGYRDHALMRRLFLEIAAEKVQEAVVKGNYQPTVLDRDFLALADEWLADHPC